VVQEDLQRKKEETSLTTPKRTRKIKIGNKNTAPYEYK
jgi:hypothetical protein